MRANILLHLVGVCQAAASLRLWCALTPACSRVNSYSSIHTFSPLHDQNIGRAVPYSTPYHGIELLLKGLFCCSPAIVAFDRKMNVCSHFPVQCLPMFKIREKELPYTDHADIHYRSPLTTTVFHPIEIGFRMFGLSSPIESGRSSQIV